MTRTNLWTQLPWLLPFTIGVVLVVMLTGCVTTPSADCADVREAVAAGEAVDYLPSGKWVLHERHLWADSEDEDECWEGGE